MSRYNPDQEPMMEPGSTPVEPPHWVRRQRRRDYPPPPPDRNHVLHHGGHSWFYQLIVGLMLYAVMLWQVVEVHKLRELHSEQAAYLRQLLQDKADRLR